MQSTTVNIIMTTVPRALRKALSSTRLASVSRWRNRRRQPNVVPATKPTARPSKNGNASRVGYGTIYFAFNRKTD